MTVRDRLAAAFGWPAQKEQPAPPQEPIVPTAPEFSRNQRFDFMLRLEREDPAAFNAVQTALTWQEMALGAAPEELLRMSTGWDRYGHHLPAPERDARDEKWDEVKQRLVEGTEQFPPMLAKADSGYLPAAAAPPQWDEIGVAPRDVWDHAREHVRAHPKLREGFATAVEAYNPNVAGWVRHLPPPEQAARHWWPFGGRERPARTGGVGADGPAATPRLAARAPRPSSAGDASPSTRPRQDVGRD